MARITPEQVMRNVALKRAFVLGFADGVDPNAWKKRHRVDPDAKLEGAWRMGFDLGKAKALEASVGFSRELDSDGDGFIPEWSIGRLTRLKR
jgi:hypothetical protein